MTTTTKTPEVKIEWRDGSALRSRWTSLAEIEKWSRGCSDNTAISVDFGHASVHYVVPVEPVARRVAELSDGSWITTDWAGFVAIVKRLEAGETCRQIYDSL